MSMRVRFAIHEKKKISAVFHGGDEHSNVEVPEGWTELDPRSILRDERAFDRWITLELDDRLAELGIESVLPLLIVEFVLLVISAANAQARKLAEHVLHARVNIAINSRIIRKALSLDLSHFENAEYYDKLQNARREADWPILHDTRLR